MTTLNNEPGQITKAVARVKKGDPTAPTDLARALQQFLKEMIRHVRRHTSPRLKARIDSHAVVYAALHSFLTGIPEGRFPALANGKEVKKVLATLVTRALSDQVRREHRQKRNPSQEQSLANHIADRRAVADAWSSDVAGLLEKLTDVVRPVHKKAMDILGLSLDGLSNAEIATKLDLGIRTIEVIKKKMRAAWEPYVREEES